MKNNCVYRIALSDLKMGLKCCNKLNTESYEDGAVRIKKSVLDFSYRKANVRNRIFLHALHIYYTHLFLVYKNMQFYIISQKTFIGKIKDFKITERCIIRPSTSMNSNNTQSYSFKMRDFAVFLILS